MKQLPLIFLLSLSGLTLQLHSAPTPEPTKVAQVATTWTGIVYQVTDIQRISGNRLNFLLAVHATTSARQEGTFIGVPAKIPKNAFPYLVKEGYYQPTPFSFSSAMLTDDSTQKVYSTVQPDPNGPAVFDSAIIATLIPNETRVASIQFMSPPPPLPVNGVTPPQTVSLLLPNAKGPIMKLVLPPPTGANVSKP